MADAPFPLPAVLRERYRGWWVTQEWTARDEPVVAHLDAPNGERRFVKVLPIDAEVSVRAEHDRLRWAGPYLPVPEIVEFGTDGHVEWLVTRGIDAVSGIEPDLLADPEPLVRALARGLRRLHEEAPVDGCPFDFRLAAALPHVERRIQEGRVDPARDFHPEHVGLAPETALERIRATAPATEDLVVCHGDYCFPNALLRRGEVVAYVDLGELAVADRWWDVAVASWSTTWNVGLGYEETFIREYGLDPDWDRIRFYRLLYDLRA